MWLALAGGLIAARGAGRGRWRCGWRRRSGVCSSGMRSRRRRSARSCGHGGVKAEVVAHLDLDKVASWSTDSFSEPRLAEIRDLAQTLDVHRAIIAPRSVDGGEMLNLVRTLKAVGVRVSVLPRLLEVVGSSVEFDDLHGVTVMGVRRFDLTRSSAAFKRAFDLLGALLGLLAVSPLLVGDRGRGEAGGWRPGVLSPAAGRPARAAFPDGEVPHDGAGRGGVEGRAA